MSGIEVAGLVLGALPLLISGIQFYHDGLVPIKIWLKYEGALERIMGDLRAEKIKYKMTCERLLAGLVPDEQLALLLNEPWGSKWKNPELVNRLEERLQDAYPTYLETVGTMMEVAESLRKKLGLDETGKPLWTGKDRKFFKSEWKKISFSLSIGEHRELLQDLDKLNELLDNLTKTSVEFEPLRQERSGGAAYKALKIICEHAQYLYEALKSGWSCQCRSNHRADLRLEIRNRARNQTRADNRRKDTHFEIVFSSNTEESAWVTEIVATKKPQSDLVVDQQSIPVRAKHLKNSVPGANTTIHSNPFSFSYARSKIAKRVNFSVGHESSSSLTLICNDGSLETQSTEVKAEIAPQVSRIYDLCREFKQVQAGGGQLGFLESNNQQYEINNVQKQASMTSISLAEILIPPQTSPPPGIENSVPRLTRTDQLQLAAILASTLLQLQTTPWLSQSWGKDDIKFYRENKSCLAAQAYVSKRFSASNRRASMPTKHPIIRNEAIFGLGIILIELSEGKPLESFETPGDLDMQGQRTFMTEYLIATRLLKRIYEREGTRYGDAVRRCIICEFDERNPDFTNESFRRKVFDGVVSPLEGVWEDFSRT